MPDSSKQRNVISQIKKLHYPREYPDFNLPTHNPCSIKGARETNVNNQNSPGQDEALTSLEEYKEVLSPRPWPLLRIFPKETACERGGILKSWDSQKKIPNPHQVFI